MNEIKICQDCQTAPVVVNLSSFDVDKCCVTCRRVRYWAKRPKSPRRRKSFYYPCS